MAVLDVFEVSKVPLSEYTSAITCSLQHLCNCYLRRRERHLCRALEIFRPVTVLAVGVGFPYAVTVVVPASQHGSSGRRADRSTTVKPRELDTVGSVGQCIQVRGVRPASVVFDVSPAEVVRQQEQNIGPLRNVFCSREQR